MFHFLLNVFVGWSGSKLKCIKGTWSKIQLLYFNFIGFGRVFVFKTPRKLIQTKDIFLNLKFQSLDAKSYFVRGYKCIPKTEIVRFNTTYITILDNCFRYFFWEGIDPKSLIISFKNCKNEYMKCNLKIHWTERTLSSRSFFLFGFELLKINKNHGKYRFLDTLN